MLFPLDITTTSISLALDREWDQTIWTVFRPVSSLLLNYVTRFLKEDQVLKFSSGNPSITIGGCLKYQRGNNRDNITEFFPNLIVTIIKIMLSVYTGNL